MFVWPQTWSHLASWLTRAQCALFAPVHIYVSLGFPAATFFAFFLEHSPLIHINIFFSNLYLYFLKMFIFWTHCFFLSALWSKFFFHCFFWCSRLLHRFRPTVRPSGGVLYSISRVSDCVPVSTLLHQASSLPCMLLVVAKPGYCKFSDQIPIDIV